MEPNYAQAEYELRRAAADAPKHTALKTKFEECAFLAADAITEAKKWFVAGDFAVAGAELRRAQREIDAAHAALAKIGV